MNITKANYDPLQGLTLTIDGLRFSVGDKRTILDAGFACLMAQDPGGEAWVSSRTGGFPAGPGWDEQQGPGFTQNPVVVALALRVWGLDDDSDLDRLLAIPTSDEARAELSRRRIPSYDGVALVMDHGRLVPKP